jgi:hypothetical protein
LLVGLKLLEDPQEGLSDEDLQALAFLGKGDALCFSLPPAYARSKRSNYQNSRLGSEAAETVLDTRSTDLRRIGNYQFHDFVRSGSKAIHQGFLSISFGQPYSTSYRCLTLTKAVFCLCWVFKVPPHEKLSFELAPRI